MKKLLLVLVILLVAAGVLAWWQEWITFTGEDRGVHVKVDPEKFKKDRAAFSKTVREKTKAAGDRIAGLWKKARGLSGNEKTSTEEKLRELEKKRDSLEKQIQDLDNTDLDNTDEDQLKRDQKRLQDNLDAVNQQIDALTKKLEKQTEP
jgi:DNA repair ATPase RecN